MAKSETKRNHKRYPCKKIDGDTRQTGVIYKGAEAIAARVGITSRMAYHYLERGLLPGYQLGTRWYMREESFQAHVAKLEAKTLTQ